MIPSNLCNATLAAPRHGYDVVARSEVAGAYCCDRGGSRFFRGITIHFRKPCKKLMIWKEITNLSDALKTSMGRRGRETSSRFRAGVEMRTQMEKAVLFRALHERPGAFIIPNPWDAGTAKLLASLGFEALATTSLGFANSLGRVDGTNTVTRDEVLANCRMIATATDLPVNADLENGYADEPRAAAEMIRLAANAGVVGGSIEDATGDPTKPIYDFALAVERVHAAVEVAHSLPVPFMLTARAENLLHGRLDLDDTIKRLQAFEKAGADVLYAPGVRDLATIRTVTASVKRPVNVVMSAADPAITAAQLADAGVKRISVGGALSRLALAAFLKGARAMKDTGSFAWVRDTVPSKELKAVFR